METVREVTGTRNIMSNKNEREGNEEIITRDETAAQILERRRKQVNNAFYCSGGMLESCFIPVSFTK